MGSQDFKVQCKDCFARTLLVGFCRSVGCVYFGWPSVHRRDESLEFGPGRRYRVAGGTADRWL